MKATSFLVRLVLKAMAQNHGLHAPTPRIAQRRPRSQTSSSHSYRTPRQLSGNTVTLPRFVSGRSPVIIIEAGDGRVGTSSTGILQRIAGASEKKLFHCIKEAAPAKGGGGRRLEAGGIETTKPRRRLFGRQRLSGCGQSLGSLMAASAWPYSPS
jgi:hypothetical protein